MYKYFKSIFAAVAVLCMAVLLTGCGASGNSKESQEQFLHMATGNTSGTYYPIGGAISELLNKDIKNMHSSVQATSGSIANINLLKDETVEFAIVQNDIANYALNGTEMFKDENKYKFETLRGLATLYPESCQCVTFQSSGIKSIADLKGKKVSVGAEGSGVEANARQILAAYGLTYDDIQPQYLSFSAGAKALKDKAIDAAFLTAGAPTAAVQDVASQEPIRILGIDDEHFKALAEKYPFYKRITIPKGTYTNLNEDVQTVSVMALLVCNSRINDDLGYQITKTIYTHLDELKAAHPAFAGLSEKQAVEGMTIEINGGAKKFFDEYENPVK